MPSINRSSSASRAATASLLTGCLLVSLAAGCYSPTLGDTPFVCASTGKQCPDDYRCDKQKNVCVRESVPIPDASPDAELTDAQLAPSKEGPVYVDGSVVQSSEGCDDKAAEPNNTTDTAFKLMNTGRITDWQICYPGDVDHYAIELSTGQQLTVRVLFKQDSADGDLDAALLNPDGQVIVTSRTADANETIELPTASVPGTYVIAVYGFGPATNRYDLDISIE